ncbi:single-strand DNA-binding protein [Kibdelosporangium banguiense]|uniref:Single-stranded DNA-binding protein n=1 Tax=Kibdelosporangium banguiense TaxID=1365924 RepID=A0ABS4T5T3_9PSEU|nr:single-stranded DNA-binding protein [Kibdelosporangium banguiense]MBP2319834.1 single-strand DNA-binding protein [Kibdelosporangium banguiense]
MAWNETRMTLVGRICTDISTRLTSDGQAMALFSVAVNERKFDRELGTWVAGNSLFMRVTCFSKLAEQVAVTFRKGDPVMAAGKIHTHRYEKDGQPRSEIELTANAIGPDLALCSIEMNRDELADRPVEAVAA